MQITRDIVIDLLPLYQSGEASPDSRAAVDEFLRLDPSLARLANDVSAPAAPANDSAALERRVVAETRATIRRRSWILAAAILCTLLPFSFVIRHDRIIFLMREDEPAAVLLFLVGAALWLLYARMTRSLRRTGL